MNRLCYFAYFRILENLYGKKQKYWCTPVAHALYALPQSWEWNVGWKSTGLMDSFGQFILVKTFLEIYAMAFWDKNLWNYMDYTV